ncbi:MAG: GNAT family N-acetyltransferase [Planctomycetota bacterium]
MTAELSIELGDSLDDLASELWDARIAGDNPARSAAFLRAVAAAHPESELVPVVVREAGAIVALTVLNGFRIDLAEVLPGPLGGIARAVRRVASKLFEVQVVMSGTLESGRAHWWWDAGRVEAGAVVDAFQRAARQRFPRASAVVFRDLMGDDPTAPAFRAALEQRGFVTLRNQPYATIPVPPGTDAERHFAGLKRRAQKGIRRMREAADEHGLSVRTEPFTDELLGELYPLYRQVAAAAEGLPLPPEPQRFYAELARRMPDHRSVSVLREPGGRAVGFLMSLLASGVSTPYVIGMDYAVPKERRVYLNLHWHAVERALERGCERIDLGLTAYVTKQILGADLVPAELCLRFRNPLLRHGAQPLLRRFGHAPQPAPRPSRRASHPAGPASCGVEPQGAAKASGVRTDS